MNNHYVQLWNMEAEAQREEHAKLKMSQDQSRTTPTISRCFISPQRERAMSKQSQNLHWDLKGNGMTQPKQLGVNRKTDLNSEQLFDPMSLTFDRIITRYRASEQSKFDIISAITE